MVEVQGYLQDLLTIDCDIQTNLQHLALVKSRESLETKSTEIKQLLKDFKMKLNEMKEFCDIYSTNEKSGFISRFNRSTDADYYSTSATLNTSSPREILVKELQIQSEHLIGIESRFRNTYLTTQAKLDQIERENLLKPSESADPKELAAKKRNINSKVSLIRLWHELNTNQIKFFLILDQLILKSTNEITSKLSDINRQLKWTENQTSDIIPVLDESSKLIRNTEQEFGFMKVVIVDGKRLLVRLSRREFTDKLLIVICLFFFFSVVLYIVWKRLFRY
jgi:hypothetical protein